MMEATYEGRAECDCGVVPVLEIKESTVHASSYH